MTDPNLQVPSRPVGAPDQDRHPSDGRDIGQIMGDLSRDVSTLMRQEVALARAEITQSAKKAGRGAGLFGGAGVAAHMALLFATFALWWLVAHLFDNDDPWFGWSFLIVAVFAVLAFPVFPVAPESLPDLDNGLAAYSCGHSRGV